VNPVVELAPREDDPRAIAPADLSRYERYLGEILSALGMDLATPGTRNTPTRLLQALVDATAGYDGDPKLLTSFPSERPHGVNGSNSEIVEGPIAFYALCEHHALPFHGVAHVGYVAGSEILGISKLTRIVQMRGVAEDGSRTVTTFWRGLYEQDADLRREFLAEVGR
jgi:GTP cyclohydrolase I